MHWENRVWLVARTIACYNTTTLNVPLNDMLITVLEMLLRENGLWVCPVLTYLTKNSKHK
jgi:hypothetical protein